MSSIVNMLKGHDPAPTSKNSQYMEAHLLEMFVEIFSG